MRATSNGAGGVAHLVDIQTLAGDLYYWSDRTIKGLPAAITADGAPATVNYAGWLTQAPTFQRYRSLQTDTGSFKVQNVFGDTLATQTERILRKSAMEGAMFVYRWWAVAAEMADLEIHGTLSVGNIDSPEITLSATSGFDGSNLQAPPWQFSETCQIPQWGSKRCGADSTAPGAVECLYSLQSCQVLERIVCITSTYYDKNFADAQSSVPQTPINRRRGV